MADNADREPLEHAQERVEAMEALAERVLAECRITLMMSFRFMDRALWKMPFSSLRHAHAAPSTRVSPRTMLSCDGHTLHYNPLAVIRSFRTNPDLVVRAYLHAVLHCIFRHPFRTVRSDTGMWSLACDICVETIALEMCDGKHALAGDDAVRSMAERIAELCGGLTPAKVYRMLLLGKGDGYNAHDQLQLVAELNGNADLFARDDHQLWDLVEPPEGGAPPQAPGGGSDDEGGRTGEPEDTPQNPDEAQSGDVPDGEGQDSNAEPNSDAQSGDARKIGDDAGQDEDSDEEQGASPEPQPEKAPSPSEPATPPPRQERQTAELGEPEYAEGEQVQPSAPADEGKGDDEEDWEQIAKQVETELQTLEKERGEGAGTFMDNLALVNRSRVNYDDFLQRFATMAEDAKLNDEEFDYIFYTYGLKLYENMPLVEPLEYKESERIREFVVAIDTSGSCSRGLIEVFLTRTYEILSRGQGFDDQVNVHIVQCDAEVQSDTVIHDMSELAEYERGFAVHGYGGTDFRPVFAFVDELVANKEFTDLRGLVYFTDGYGTFPEAPPNYDVAFVFVEEEGKQRRVPPWAMKVVLDEDTLQEMRGEGAGF